MVFDIQIGQYKLGMVESVEINKSVDLLTDTATVVLPAVVFNQSLQHENFVKVGDPIAIHLGYNDTLTKEFDGYIQRIDTDDGALTFNCENSMYLTRKAVPDKQFLKTSIKAIAQYCLGAIGFKNLVCDYDITYEKFVISRANAFDVFKKLKEETKASIYMTGDTLHIHPPYTEKGGTVIYDFSVNIEQSDLKYRRKDDRKYEIQITGVGMDGKKKTLTTGTTGGERISINIANPMSEKELKKRAETELSLLCFDGYEGSITGWLIPYVSPTYSAKIIDTDYTYKTGTYYVKGVQTNFSEAGGVRKVELGKKLS